MVTLYGQEEVFRDYVASQKFSSEVKGIVELSRELGRSFEDTIAYVSKKFNVPDEIIQRKVSSFLELIISRSKILYITIYFFLLKHSV